MKYKFLIAITILGIGCTTQNRFQRPNFESSPDISKIQYSNNTGESEKEAIIILNAKNSNQGIAAEYAYLEKEYGKKGVHWILISRGSYTIEETERIYDKMVLKLSGSNDEVKVYFDITNFYGKW